MPRALVVAAVALLASTSLLPVPEALGQPPAVAERASPCPSDAPHRAFNVVALQVPISYNHWGDFDPQGRLFVLAEDEAALRDEVAGTLERAGHATAARVLRDPARAPSELGYRFPSAVGGAPRLDPIDVSPLARPLVVRSHVGDCVSFHLTNKLLEPVSLHVHRALTPAAQGMALGQELPDLVQPGETRAFVAYVPDEPGMEGAHFLHSHADARFQTRHGLFGALVAEPAGSSWLAPDGTGSTSGPEAMILRPGAADFREIVVIMHDQVELVDRSLKPLPALSAYGEYGPGSKGINLRAEPFMDRFALHDELGPDGLGALDRGHDKSLAYSSYAYGDPATFIPMAYVGDPTKIRAVNAGPGQHHVFHLHGGGVRWRASPVSEDTQMDDGLVKDNPVPQAASERQDVQNIGPGESFNLEVEGGAGGVQRSVGDFLFHCHVVEHYMAGMWSFWRVYNTLQPGLAELPDREGLVREAVDSIALLSAGHSAESIEGQLPARGMPGGDDASFWDWTVQPTPQGPLYLGEPETTIVWPNYESAAPGERLPLKFNPVDGRLSYPFLTPHFGKRPPFAPAHGPAPHLGETTSATRPDGLCPPDAPLRRYDVVALSTPVRYNEQDVDEDGRVFVLAEDKRAVIEGAKPARNLVIRANVGDCVDVLLTSQLAEPEGGHSKVNMHTHLVQFDVQASDGVITGLHYEQSVRPAAVTGAALAAAAEAGDTHVRLSEPGTLRVGERVGIGLTEAHVELRTVVAVDAEGALLDAPLGHAHAAGERVGPEFVRYRWFADVELGMVYWHDHVDGLESWRHGLFGGLVVEPRASLWRDPVTGAPVREGPLADIIAPGSEYRELVLEFQDRSGDMGSGEHERCLASFNLRSEPFDARPGETPLASAEHGDPATDMLRAYPGDPVVVRLMYAGNANTRAVGTFALTGHRFPVEQHNPGSRSVDSISFGMSSQHNLRIECGAGGCERLPGDYLYGMTQPDLLRRGAWGILRVHGEAQPDLLPLPGRGVGEPGSLDGQPARRYQLVALSTEVTFNGRLGIAEPRAVFVLASEAEDVAAGRAQPTPLVIRALPGELVEVSVENRLDRPVSLHAGLVAEAPNGVPVGDNPDPRVAPGETRAYRWRADSELGVVHVSSFARPADDALAGLHGALVVEPAGSSFEPATGPSARLRLADGSTVREHTLLFASDDPDFEGSVMPYSHDVKGIVSVNHRTEPLAERLGGRAPAPGSGGEPVGGTGVHTCQLNTDSCSVGAAKELRAEARHPLAPFGFHNAFGAPETPVLDARAGEPLVLRVLGGAGDQLQVFSLAGHWWRRDPAMAGSELVDAQTIGPREAVNAWLIAGLPGDHLWGTQREAFRDAGAWGILRVGGGS